MYNGIGLSTVRGSATSGYVQRNLSFVGSKQSRKDTHRKEESNLRSTKDSMFGKSQPNQGILDHERKRKIEVKCLEMEELLREQGVEDTEITLKVDTYRSMLNDKEKSKRMEDGDESLETDEFGRAVYKDSHQFAKAQKAKNDKLKRAFAISDSYEDGSGFDRREEKIKKAALDVVDILIHSDSVDGNDMANAKSASKHHTKKSKKKKSKLKKEKNRHHASKKKSRRRHRFSSTDHSSDSTSSDSSSDSDGDSSSLERKRREKRRRRVPLDRHDRDRHMKKRDTRPSPDYSQKGPSSMRRRSSPSHSPYRRDRRDGRDDYNRRGRSRSREDRRRHLGGHNRNRSPSRSDHHYKQETGGAPPSPSKRNGSSLHRVSYREPRFVEQNACNHVVNGFGGVDDRPPVVPEVRSGRDEAAVATEKRRMMRKLRRDAREKRGGDRSPRSSGELSTSSASSEDEMVNGHEAEKNAVQHHIADSKDVSGKTENSIKSDAKLSNLESNVRHKSTKEKGEESDPSSSTNTPSRRVNLSGEMRTRADSKKSPLQFPKVSRSNVDRIARHHDSHSSASDDEEQSHEKLVSTSLIRIRSPETKVTTHKIDESDELQKASNRKSSVKHGGASLSSNSTKGKNQSISNVAVEELDSKLIVLKKQTDLESDKQELKRLRKERIKAEILELQKKVSLKEKEDTLKSKDKENGHGDANKRRGDPVAIKNGTDTTKHKKRNGKIDSPKKVKATTNKQKGKKNNKSASSSSSSEGDSSSSADSTGSSEDRSGDSSSSDDEKFDHEKRKRPSDDKPINNSKKTVTKNGNCNVHDNKKQQKNDADDDDKLMLTVQKLMKKDNRQPMKSPPPSKFAKGTLKNNRSSTTAVKVEKKKTATENKKEDESRTINDDRIDLTNKKPVSKSSSAVIRKGKLDVVTKEITANKRMPSKRSSSSSSRSSSSSSSRSSSSSDSSNRRSSGSSRSSEDNDSSGGRGSSDTSASSDSDSESERRGRRRGGKSAK